MNYRSDWNDKIEMCCLLVFKLLQSSNLASQSDMLKKLENNIKENISLRSLRAKVGNYKSVARVNKPSNASKNTKRIYQKYDTYAIEALKNEIRKENCPHVDRWLINIEKALYLSSLLRYHKNVC